MNEERKSEFVKDVGNITLLGCIYGFFFSTLADIFKAGMRKQRNRAAGFKFTNEQHEFIEEMWRKHG